MNIATVVSAVASLSWLIVILAIGVTVLRASRGESARGGTTLILGTIVLALVLNVVSAGLVFVPPQDRGVVITVGEGGVRTGVLQPGLRWVIPFAENVVLYPISRQTYTMSQAAQEGQIVGDDSVQARTSDGQVIFVDASVIFTIDPTQVVDVHIKWQNNYVDDLVRPQSRGVIRDAVAVFQVDEVYSSRRDEMRNQIATRLASKLEAEGLLLIDFVLRNVSFSPEYAASVEAKQVAEQQAQQAFLVVEQRVQEAEQARQQAQGQADAVAIAAEGDARALLLRAQAEADARLIQAQAEAEALTLLGIAIRDNPDILTLEYIQKLSPNIRIMLLPNDNPYLLPIPSLEDDTSIIQVPTSTPAPTPVPTPAPTDEGGG
jgi:regulator of protease activity HflC (stomatin/prohibitin superfamily)